MTDLRQAPLIVGNWKMHKTIQESVDFINQLGPSLTSTHPTVYLAVPFTAIYPAAKAAHPYAITVGAQNMNDVAEGAFTGEIAGKMLKEAGAYFVILGHSERRRLFNETNQAVNQKVQRALNEGLDVIVCVGETAAERDAQKTEEILKEQIEMSLQGIEQEQFQHIILAYEPVWAIGTNQTATPENAAKMHAYARERIAAKWGEETSASIKILYGGSVKAENAQELMLQSDIDGLLVGGASLSVECFRKIIEYQNFNSGVST